MNFELKGHLVLTKPVGAKQVEPLLKQAEPLLKKGAGSGTGAAIKSFSVSGKKLKFHISSDRYVRAHDALLRLRKFLAGKLGPTLKVGIREMGIEEYKIVFPVKGKDGKLKIPLASSVTIKKNSCTILLKDLDDEFIQRNYIDRIISLVEEKVAEEYGAKKEHWELLWQSGKKQPAWDKDPTVEMERRRWIQRTTSRGQWIIGPIPTQIMRTMEQIVVDELIKPLGFSEMMFPKMVTWDVWEKSGHAKGVYPELYYVCPPQTRDKEFWADIADSFKVTGKVDAEAIKKKIKAPIGGMCYAQCPPFWPYLQSKTLAESNLPIRVFDRSGTSMRYEGGGIHGIERVDEFHRIEILWLGKPEETIKLHQQIQELFRDIFHNILDLEVRTAWVTPWFLAQEGKTELADTEKRVGTVDYEAYMPYRGTREKSEWLEFQNASNNGPKYPAAFNVKPQSGKELWSGCVGVGLERWLAAFTAQKGLDQSKWPKPFQQRFGKMASEIKFM